MPTPTVIHEFGESVGEDVFCVIELDRDSNIDAQGEVKTQFEPGDSVYILVHVEEGVRIEDINSSFGDIVNKSSLTLVQRSNTIEDVIFPSTDTKYELPHMPLGTVAVEWEGFSSTLTQDGRTLTSASAPRICTVTYKYKAYLFRLLASDFVLAAEETFSIDVAVEVLK